MFSIKKLFQFLLFSRIVEDGGAAPDRGDVVTPPDVAAEQAAQAAADTEATAEAQAVKDAEELAAAEAATAEDKPRDQSGKFAKKEKDDNVMIPKSRFDAQLQKERDAREAAERRAKELEDNVSTVKRNLDVEKAVADVSALRKQERAALLDGNEDKAAEFAAQADRLNRQIAISESEQLSTQAKDSAIESIRMEMTVERLEEKFPQLVEGHDEYDKGIVDDILDKQQGLMARERLSPSKALARATEYVMGRLNTSAAPNASKAGGLGAAKTEVDRKAASVAKNLAASKQQPASTSAAGLDSDKAGQTKELPNVKDLTYEEFNALPETTRARMRGDVL